VCIFFQIQQTTLISSFFHSAHVTFSHSSQKEIDQAKDRWAASIDKPAANEAQNFMHGLFNAHDYRRDDLDADFKDALKTHAFIEIQKYINLLESAQALTPHPTPNLVHRVFKPEGANTRRRRQEQDEYAAHRAAREQIRKQACQEFRDRASAQAEAASSVPPARGAKRERSVKQNVRNASHTELDESANMPSTSSERDNVTGTLSFLLSRSLFDQTSYLTLPERVHECRRGRDLNAEDSENEEIRPQVHQASCASSNAFCDEAYESSSFALGHSGGHSSSGPVPSAFHLQRNAVDDRNHKLAMQLQEEEWQRDPIEATRLTSSAAFQSSAFSNVGGSALSLSPSFTSSMAAFPQGNIRGERMYCNRLDQRHSRSSKSAAGSRPNISNVHSHESNGEGIQGSLGISQSFEELMHEGGQHGQ
jgi:hypothetical protein